MKRIPKTLLGIVLILMVSGCVSITDYQALEKRIAHLEKKKTQDLQALAEQTGANKFWWRSCLTGGGSCLDGIADTLLTNNDAAFVVVSGTTIMYPFMYASGATAAESSPTIIVPDTYPTTGVWYLMTFGITGVSGYAADGYHYFKASNTNDLTSGEVSKGRCWWNETANQFKCGTGSGTSTVVGP